MENSDLIDLCAVKSEKSEDTSTTIPMDENENTKPTALGIFEAENTTFQTPEYENFSRQDLTEQWILQQNANIPSLIDSLKHNNQFTDKHSVSTETYGKAHLMNMAVMIPTEIIELVNKDCAIKLINYLVIYAINKVTEVGLHRKLLFVTPDIDPQINYHSKMRFQGVYERCVVLFYEALMDLTIILGKFESPLQYIIVLWMYNTVECICKANDVDCTFLRNDKYIESLLRDFMNSQKGEISPENIFYNIHSKMHTNVNTAPSK